MGTLHHHTRSDDAKIIRKKADTLVDVICILVCLGGTTFSIRVIEGSWQAVFSGRWEHQESFGWLFIFVLSPFMIEHSLKAWIGTRRLGWKFWFALVGYLTAIPLLCWYVFVPQYVGFPVLFFGGCLLFLAAGIVAWLAQDEAGEQSNSVNRYPLN